MKDPGDGNLDPEIDVLKIKRDAYTSIFEVPLAGVKRGIEYIERYLKHKGINLGDLYDKTEEGKKVLKDSGSIGKYLKERKIEFAPLIGWIIEEYAGLREDHKELSKDINSYTNGDPNYQNKGLEIGEKLKKLDERRGELIGDIIDLHLKY